MTNLINGGSGTAGDQLVPFVDVLVNGAPLPPDAAAVLTSTTVQQDVDHTGMFALRLLHWDMARKVSTWSDPTLFRLGDSVKVRVGYRGAMAATLMSGEVTGWEPEFEAGEAPALVVRGHDRRHRLLRGRQTRTFTRMTDSAIVKQIAEERGFSIVAQATTVQHEHVYQHNQTDLEFVLERAARIGFELTIDHNAPDLDRSLLFRRRQSDQHRPPVLDADGDVLSFHPRLTDMGNAARVVVRASNPSDPGAPFEATARPSGAGGGAREGELTLIDTAATARDAADFADAHRTGAAQWRVTGSGTCIGRPDVHAGTHVELRGFGPHFSGTYYVAAAVHTLDATSGYRTTFTVRKDAP